MASWDCSIPTVELTLVGVKQVYVDVCLRVNLSRVREQFSLLGLCFVCVTRVPWFSQLSLVLSVHSHWEHHVWNTWRQGPLGSHRCPVPRWVAPGVLPHHLLKESWALTGLLTHEIRCAFITSYVCRVRLYLWARAGKQCFTMYVC